MLPLENWNYYKVCMYYMKNLSQATRSTNNTQWSIDLDPDSQLGLFVSLFPQNYLQ